MKTKPKMRIIKIYKPNNLFGKDLHRKLDEKKLARKGYYPISEEEVQKYDAGKGILFGLLFLPLALLGCSKKIKVIYEKNST